MGNSTTAEKTERFSISSMSDAAFTRAFAQRFPAITLEEFRCNRKGAGCVLSSHWALISGAAAELLRLGFLQEGMIPPGRTRKLHGSFGSHKGSGSSWSVRCVKGGRLEAYFHINGDDLDKEEYPDRSYVDDFPADHPLQMFHPRHWPFGDAREQRTYFESTRADARSWIGAHVAELDTNLAHMTMYGYCVRAADRDRMRDIVQRFGDELLQAFDNASVVSEQAPQLRLIAGQGRGARPGRS